MPDERPRFGRLPQRHDSHPCPPHEGQPLDTCPVCGAQLLRAYRVIRRYRGDRQVRELEPGGWCQLWRLQRGDVSWPNARQG